MQPHLIALLVSEIVRRTVTCDTHIVDITTALLTRWIHDPASRDFDLRDLVVVTAMTGEELPRTRLLMQTYVLPLMRRHASVTSSSAEPDRPRQPGT